MQRILDQVMGATQIALWEGFVNPLTVRSFKTGTGDAKSFGLAAPQIAAGALWNENVYPPDRDKLRVYLNRWGTSPRATGSVDYRLIVGEGELLWVRHWTLSRTRSKTGDEVLRNILMPIPEQKHLEWECLRVSERECNRIGQELHDDLCQVLAGLTFMVRVIGQRAKKADPSLSGEIDELDSHLSSATDRVRSMAHGLFPSQLHYATLRHALTAYAAEARTLFRVRFTLKLPRQIPPHDPEQIIHVYRIVQESVSNAVRHGKATAIRILMSNSRDAVKIQIEDNGGGFPSSSARPEGIGMHVMQYRARVLGGSVTFRHLSPHGVAVVLSYPTSHAKAGSKSKLAVMP